MSDDAGASDFFQRMDSIQQNLQMQLHKKKGGRTTSPNSAAAAAQHHTSSLFNAAAERDGEPRGIMRAATRGGGGTGGDIFADTRSPSKEATPSPSRTGSKMATLMVPPITEEPKWRVPSSWEAASSAQGASTHPLLLARACSPSSSSSKRLLSTQQFGLHAEDVRKGSMPLGPAHLAYSMTCCTSPRRSPGLAMSVGRAQRKIAEKLSATEETSLGNAAPSLIRSRNPSKESAFSVAAANRERKASKASEASAPWGYGEGASTAIEQRLKVCIIRATGLRHLDIVGNAPWCVCEVQREDAEETKPSKCRTRCQPLALDPIWDEAHELTWSPGESLSFTIYDKSVLGNRAEGQVLLTSSEFYPNGFEGELPISGEHAALLHIRVSILEEIIDLGVSAAAFAE